MKTLTAEDLISTLATQLEKDYPDEVFLSEEMYAVTHGLFNSLRWAALKKAKQLAQAGELNEPMNILDTTDHFCSEWLERHEVVDCIMHTSGLDEEISAFILRSIERTIDYYLAFDSVAVDFLGRIEQPEQPRYHIELANTLSVQPNAQKATQATPRSATAN